MVKIKFSFEEGNKQEINIEDNLIGKSILEIADQFKIPLHDNCGGVCACSTCHVYINKGEKFLNEISDNEDNFIDRAIEPKIESRLGCQAKIQKDNAILEITIPDQTMIIGHEH